MKLRLSTLVPLAGLLMSGASSADTFVLKNGERLDAKILKETDDSYVLDVKVTKSIRDEKTVAKADVAEIIPEKTDEVAFEALKGLLPTPDLLPADEYTRRITLIGKFTKENPKSPLVADAEKMLATLKEELAAISAGGVKLDGKIISAGDYASDAYDIDARMIEKRVREAAARGDLVSAMRGIERLQKEYKLTGARRGLLPLKAQILRAYKAQIDELLSTFDARTEERRVGLGQMSGDARANAERALAEELAALKASAGTDKDSKQRWAGTHPLDKDSLEEAQETIEDEMDDTIEDNGKDAGKVYRNIHRIIGEQSDREILEETVAKAEEYEIPERYIDKLKEAAKAKGAQF
ncbi:MAG: hypothetical protein EOP87_04395 [Verrucomicrobiaceae bacterium]|nr:MAG: hypothetical protein EOP87_04395 [Verrucomicrobiaceae bacterium]